MVLPLDGKFSGNSHQWYWLEYQAQTQLDQEVLGLPLLSVGVTYNQVLF